MPCKRLIYCAPSCFAYLASRFGYYASRFSYASRFACAFSRRVMERPMFAPGGL
jgi:hypothetical protein